VAVFHPLGHPTPNAYAFYSRTADVDNDMDARSNCAKKCTGGWWFKDCDNYVNLNGGYFKGGSAPYGKGSLSLQTFRLNR
jgi:hypothetical protein